jgi:hypothetical protein
VKIRIVFWFVVLFAIVISWAILSISKGRDIDLRVSRVMGGDVVELNDGRQVKLFGLDLESKDRINQDRAMLYLSTELQNRTVWLEMAQEMGSDSFGRDMVFLWVGCEDGYLMPSDRWESWKPEECKNGDLINLKLVEYGMAKVDKSTSQVLYITQMLKAQELWEYQQVKDGYKIFETSTIISGVEWRVIEVRRYPGTIFDDYRLKYKGGLDVKFDSGVLKLGRAGEQMTISQLPMDRVICSLTGELQVGLDLSKSKIYERLIRDERYLWFESERGDGWREYNVCQRQNDEYRLGSRYGFVRVFVPDTSRSLPVGWWMLFESIEGFAE